MIGARGGDVECPDPIGQDANAVSGEPAKDGCECGRTEARGADARLARQGLADALSNFASEVRLIENGDAAEHVGRFPPNAGHDDRIMSARVFGIARRRVRGRVASGCSIGGASSQRSEVWLLRDGANYREGGQRSGQSKY